MTPKPTLNLPPWWRSANSWQRRRWIWAKLASRAEQLPPAGDWLAWWFMGGRGTGKTRAGAEDIADHARQHHNARYALVAPTLNDVRATMVEGESGLLSVLPVTALKGQSVERGWNRGTCELYLANGCYLRGFTSERPGRLRGPQHHRAWAEEPGEWKDAHRGDVLDTTWNNMVLGLRLGDDPRVVVTGTPKPKALFKCPPDHAGFPGLLQNDRVVVTHGTTYDNLANLAPTFKAQILDKYEGTRLGRQELLAQYLEDVEGALWQRLWFDEQRVYLDREPKMSRRGIIARTIVALDPADGLEEGDEQAITVACLDLNWRYYVVHSEGVRLDAVQWVRRAIRLFDHYKADLLVYEKNHGGAFLKATIETAVRDLGALVAHKAVDASDGKRTRAEPIAMLYEQGKVSHVGVHDVLEDQMANYTGAPGEKSPDRLDATVWALTELAKTPKGSFDPGPRSAKDKGETSDLATANF